MSLLLPSIAALAVTAIFCTWRCYQRVEYRRRQRLCERVAYLLWMSAMSQA